MLTLATVGGGGRTLRSSFLDASIFPVESRNQDYQLRMRLWMGLKPDGEFSYKGSDRPGVQIKDHSS